MTLEKSEVIFYKKINFFLKKVENMEFQIVVIYRRHPHARTLTSE